MGVFAGFARHPQSVWLRRALFQVHLWIGLGVGLYIFVISLSGSLIVFRREYDRALCPGTLLITPSGRRITAVCEPAFVTWMAEFHDHLCAGRTGLFVNGLGAMAVVIMCVTGIIIWWPGRARWRRSLTLHRGASARRFLWELHNVLGFWTMLLILMWAVTGIYFAFSNPFNSLIDWVSRGGVETSTSRALEAALDWLVRLHFGRSFGLAVEITWVILGLLPCALFVTGTLVWWNRVVRKAMPASSPPGEALRVTPISQGESVN
jgi:uncharacterized iron-regulated membrane protein